MKHTIYVVLTRSGIDRMIKTQPDRKIGEYPIAIVLNVPDDLFKSQPIPVVEVAISPKQINAGLVSVDGVPAAHPIDEEAMKQVVLQEQFADLFESARGSADPAMRDLADVILGKLLDAGVDVRIARAETQE